MVITGKSSINYLTIAKISLTHIHLNVAEECEKKWKDLCDTFRCKEKSGAEGTTVEERSASWCFYDCMSFMHPHIQSQRCIYNCTLVILG